MRDTETAFQYIYRIYGVTVMIMIIIKMNHHVNVLYNVLSVLFKSIYSVYVSYILTEL